MSLDEALTPSEAGYVLGRSATAINKAVDTGVIQARKRRRGKGVQRLLGSAELRFLRLNDELDKDLSPAGRRRFYEALRKLPENKHRLQMGPIVVDLGQIDADLKARLRQLDKIRKQIEAPAGKGDAVIRGTDISVHPIAALAQGQTIEEVLEDYPSLNRIQVEAAVEYAKAYPKRGRPYPKRSFKRMLGDLAALGTFDEDADHTDIEPRAIP